MADLSRLETALRNADAAGDVDAARALAGEITRARTAAPQQANPVVDAAKSLGVGAAEGAIGIASGGDIRNLASKATDYVGGKLGASPETLETIKDIAYNVAKGNPFTAPIALGPTSQELQKKVEEKTGEFYQPKTEAGEYARTVGQFLPAAATGPGGVVRRGLMQAAVPGIASEYAGQATKGTEAEPYARAGTALLAGALGAKRVSPQQVTADDLRGAAKQAYNDPAVKGVVIDPAAASRLAQTTERTMESGGARRAFAAPAFNVNDELRNLPDTQVGRAMKAAGLSPGATIDDIKSVRTALGKVVEDGTDALTGKLNSTAGAAVSARKKITEYLSNIPARDVRSGDAATAGRLLKNADADYAASMRGNTVDALLRRAELQAGSSNSGQNVNNATRQKLRQLLTNEKKTAGFSDAQIKQLEKAVLGTKTGNTARFLGNWLAPSGALAMVPGAGVGGAALAFGADPSDAATLGLMSALAGRGARRIGNASTQRQVAKFQKGVMANAPSYLRLQSANSANAAKLTAAERRAALARALISSQLAPRQPAPVE